MENVIRISNDLYGSVRKIEFFYKGTVHTVTPERHSLTEGIIEGRVNLE